MCAKFDGRVAALFLVVVVVPAAAAAAQSPEQNARYPSPPECTSLLPSALTTVPLGLLVTTVLIHDHANEVDWLPFLVRQTAEHHL